jgi:DNA replication and repair protein RecF
MGINILYGDNAQGKTNFLEAVYICATGRSPRKASDKEMIRFGVEEAHVQALADRGGTQIDIFLRKAGKKSAAVNGLTVRKLGDLFGRLLTVSFSPEDLQLVKAGPGERRHFMDIELCQLDQVYYYELQQYYKVLKQRNHLLKAISQKIQDSESLFVWDGQLAEHGRRVVSSRQAFTERLNPLAAEVHASITGGKERLTIAYRPCIEGDDWEARLRRTAKRDIIYGSTSVGIHKDDLMFSVNEIDVRTYGSQGQQRTASLAAKLAEVCLMREWKNQDPILLLDDVLSELDEHRQHFLLDCVKNIQTVITCTGIEEILRRMPHQAVLMQMVNGQIERHIEKRG